MLASLISLVARRRDKQRGIVREEAQTAGVGVDWKLTRCPLGVSEIVPDFARNLQWSRRKGENHSMKRCDCDCARHATKQTMGRRRHKCVSLSTRGRKAQGCGRRKPKKTNLVGIARLAEFRGRGRQGGPRLACRHHRSSSFEGFHP